MHDYRELVPEFYYSPEMFINTNKNTFGTCRNEEVIDHV